MSCFPDWVADSPGFILPFSEKIYYDGKRQENLRRKEPILTAENTRTCGAEKEAQAAAYLAKRGVQILCRNFRCRQGEIDLIGQDGEYLVFIEVKYRGSDKYADPLSAVGIAKQRKICKVADYYRCVKQIPTDTPVRYDVVGIGKEETAWIVNAFPHRFGRG